MCFWQSTLCASNSDVNYRLAEPRREECRGGNLRYRQQVCDLLERQMVPLSTRSDAEHREDR